jgi:hypothetical protein
MRHPRPSTARARGRPATTVGTVLVLCLCGICAAVTALPGPNSAQASDPTYPLYYALDMPPVLTGFELNQVQEKHILYSGTLRGSLGGLPVEKAAITLRPGASPGAGGGDFSLQTPAGEIKNGLVLMTTDKKQTSLLFSGVYLGARVAFRVSGPATDVASTAYSGKGLADSTFADHTTYLAAVSQGVAKLPAAARAQTLADADRNLSLVSTYRQETGTP